MRTGCLIFLLLWTLTGTIGCGSGSRVTVESQDRENDPVRLGVLPFTDRVALEKYYQILTSYWSEELKIPVVVVPCPDYDSLSEHLLQDRIDLAWFSGYSFLEARGKAGIVPLVRVRRDGSETYRGLVVTRADGPTTLEGLKGKRFAYIDRNSGSGFLAPNQLFEAAGIDPLKDFAAISFTHSHRDSLAGLLAGRFEGAAVFEGAVEAVGKDPKAFQVIARSGLLENDVIACQERLLEDVGVRIRTICVQMPDSQRGRDVLAKIRETMNIDGFRALDGGAGAAGASPAAGAPASPSAGASLPSPSPRGR